MLRPRQRKPAAKASFPPRTSASRGSLLLKLAGTHPASKSARQKLLREHGFHDAPRVLAAIGQLYKDELQRRNLAKVFGHLIHACEKSADPDRALINFERLVAALPNPNIFYHYLHASTAAWHVQSVLEKLDAHLLEAVAHATQRGIIER